MEYYSSQISKLIEELSRLPSIGAKTAQRLAFHIINMPQEQVESLSKSIIDAKTNVRYCKECFNELIAQLACDPNLPDELCRKTIVEIYYENAVFNNPMWRNINQKLYCQLNG